MWRSMRLAAAAARAAAAAPVRNLGSRRSVGLAAAAAAAPVAACSLIAPSFVRAGPSEMLQSEKNNTFTGLQRENIVIGAGGIMISASTAEYFRQLDSQKVKKPRSHTVQKSTVEADKLKAV
mmetsp:Transcript_59951/g.106931  ORF Transcript_59951/g.106931 Transcript_59951/m.106931 type:complete len:122 (-) Transcript_59951:133-498(-)